MDYLSLLQILNTCHGPSGDEREVAEAIRHLAEPYADECVLDTMGNLIVQKKGSGPKVMFAAHMDSIGLIVTHIDEKGYLSFGKLGDIHPESLLHTPVRFRNGVRGVVALRQSVPWKDMTVNDLYLDIGAKNGESAKSMVQIGDTAVTDLPAFAAGSRLVSPCLDNRASCIALLKALERIEQNVNDLYFVFTVQKELGLRGCKPAAYAVDPDYGITVDATPADELDKKQIGCPSLGGGAAIKIMDNSVICHPEVVNSLENAAITSNIPYQKDVMMRDGTDGGSIHVARSGVKTGGISVPCRYLHSPVEMVEISDLQAVEDLVVKISESKLFSKDVM